METLDNVEQSAIQIEAEIKNACNNAAPKNKPPRGKTSMYWWSDNIAELRAIANRAYRRWKRGLRKCRVNNVHNSNNVNSVVNVSNNNVHSVNSNSRLDIEGLRNRYKVAQKKLRREIGKSKSGSWKELLDTIDEDPWGLPYRIVLRRRKGSTPSVLDALEDNQRRQLIESLFPPGGTHDPVVLWGDYQVETEWNEECHAW